MDWFNKTTQMTSEKHNEKAGDLTSLEYWDKIYFDMKTNNRGMIGLIRRKINWKYDRMICRMLDAIGNKQANILELGCAPGAILERIHRLRPQLRLAGIDYNEEGVKITRDRLNCLGIEAKIYWGDFRTVRLPIKFDAAVSFGLIEHFEDPIKILKCHKNFLVPGGLVAVTVPNFSHPFVANLIRRFEPDTFRTHNLMIMNEKSLLAALESCELENVLVEGSGGPRLDFQAKNFSHEARIYNIAARAWNILTAISPDMFWHAHVWGTGRVKWQR